MPHFSKTARTLRRLWSALQSGDPGAVHEVRKLTRRAQAQLRVARAPKRTRRAWRDLRRAVAAVRDRDAVGEQLVQALKELKVPPQVLSEFQSTWAGRRSRTFAAVSWPDPPPAVKRPRAWKARVRKTLRRDAHHLLREAEQVFHTDCRPFPYHPGKSLMFLQFPEIRICSCSLRSKKFRNT
ncbi:CHAD domain-containing protein [Deinococcus arcticus]|uniref:Uncharacterized protein n=1 Tax=Deinococcus arcticus TaxID=2136176 RepID=A0A2T3W409_9DEIO|nr:CHAD domain-containing protein [Deinococcus arcticus]PTA66641.1 hypothetical protein C8263_16875 [Deinococcus arcticus]